MKKLKHQEIKLQKNRELFLKDLSIFYFNFMRRALTVYTVSALPYEQGLQLCHCLGIKFFRGNEGGDNFVQSLYCRRFIVFLRRIFQMAKLKNEFF